MIESLAIVLHDSVTTAVRYRRHRDCTAALGCIASRRRPQRAQPKNRSQRSRMCCSPAIEAASRRRGGRGQESQDRRVVRVSRPIRPMPTASLIKFPVMIATYQAIDEASCRSTTMIELKKEDQVPGSGILTTHFSPGTRSRSATRST